MLASDGVDDVTGRGVERAEDEIDRGCHRIV